MRHDVSTAVAHLDEASSSSEWTRNLQVTSRLGQVLADIDQLLRDLDGDSACLARACLDLPADAGPVETELLRIEMEALRHSAIAGLKLLTEKLPRAVDALNAPSELADTALATADIVVRRRVVLTGSSLLDALRELVAACGRVAVPLREIVRRSTCESWNDLQIVECLNEAVLLGLERGLRYVVGSVDTPALVPAGTALTPPVRRRAKVLPDRLVQCALPWWGVSFEDWIATEKARTRRVNRFALWSGRGSPTRLFLFAGDVEPGEPILLLGDEGHHPMMTRFARYAGTLSPQSQARSGRSAPCASRTRHDALVVDGCPPEMRDGVRRQLEQVSRRPVTFR